MSGNNLKKARKKKRWTLKKAADKFGITFQYLNHLEEGNKTNPSTKLLNDFIKTYGPEVALDYLPALEKRLGKDSGGGLYE